MEKKYFPSSHSIAKDEDVYSALLRPLCPVLVLLELFGPHASNDSVL